MVCVVHRYTSHTANISSIQYDQFLIKIAERGFENVAKFRYLRTTITNQNLIQEEIKRRLLPFNPEPFVFSSKNI
jgi:hypothetical protein